MPKWGKIVLVVVGTGVVLLGIFGYMGVKALHREIDKIEDSLEEAKAEGEAFGLLGTLDEAPKRGFIASVIARGLPCSESLARPASCGPAWRRRPLNRPFAKWRFHPHL